MSLSFPDWTGKTGTDWARKADVGREFVGTTDIRDTETAPPPRESVTDIPQSEAEGLPTVTCSRCGRSWDLEYELDDLQVGNRALERFALDHRRHTGHFPDDVTPWLVECRRCPDDDAFLSEEPARRWAETHARHTRHTVEVSPPETDEPDRVDPDRE